MQRIKRIWLSIESLDDRVYFLTVTVSILISIVTLITNMLQGLSMENQLVVAGLGAAMLLLLILGIRFPARRRLLRLCLVLVMDFVLFPVSFFFSGGIHSGMILFFLIGLFLVPVMIRGKASIFIFALAMIWMILMVEISQRFPELVAPMTAEQHFQDVKVTLLLSGAGLYLVTFLILGAYDQERKKNEKLMNSLRNLSVRDALSGLYNRRELFRRLEVMYQGREVPQRRNTLVRDNHYIVMLDLDNFKSVNDTYGHGVGDEVLKVVSRLLEEMVHGEEGEIAARYGGEEFVCLLAAGSMEEAFGRVDGMRQHLAGMKWKNDRPPQMTISGGIISCTEDEDLTRSMHMVDELLYQAKAQGKNRICCED